MFDKVASASLAYRYSQGFVIGEAGLQNTQAATATISVEPIRSLKVSLGAIWSRFEGSAGANPTITTYGVAVTASYQIFKWLSALASYTFSYQEQSSGNIPHSVLSAWPGGHVSGPDRSVRASLDGRLPGTISDREDPVERIDPSGRRTSHETAACS